MGIIGHILGIGRSAQDIGGAVERVAEVFIPNRTKELNHHYKHQQTAADQFSQEFRYSSSGKFDRLVNGLNRLPRPVMALGTVGLFTHAMIDPNGFSIRMQGLDSVPEPLWWLLGAVVSFYFGARELHHMREKRKVKKLIKPARFSSENEGSGNAALDEWLSSMSDAD